MWLVIFKLRLLGSSAAGYSITIRWNSENFNFDLRMSIKKYGSTS